MDFSGLSNEKLLDIPGEYRLGPKRFSAFQEEFFSRIQKKIIPPTPALRKLVGAFISTAETMEKIDLDLSHQSTRMRRLGLFYRRLLLRLLKRLAETDRQEATV
jgi:hypothetical protein